MFDAGTLIVRPRPKKCQVQEAARIRPAATAQPWLLSESSDSSDPQDVRVRGVDREGRCVDKAAMLDERAVRFVRRLNLF